MPWTRFWADVHNPTTRESDWVSPEGFLRIETDAIRRIARMSAVAPLEEYEQTRCLVLLGDAGMGKSAILTQRALAIKNTLAETNNLLIDEHASIFRTPADIRTELLQRDEISAWKEGAMTLHLLIDALDEAPVGLPILLDRLVDAIATWPTERLRLRISCRPMSFSAIWVRRLSDALVRSERARASLAQPTGLIESADLHVKVLALQPLTREDALAYAKRELGDDARASAFLEQVNESRVETFASLPLTLPELCRRFRRGESIALRIPELYDALCEHLCEPAPARRDTAIHHPLPQSKADWLAVAAGVCAALVFGQYRGIWLGESRAADGFLAFHDFLRIEDSPFGDVRATESILRVVASSALFSSTEELGGNACVVAQRSCVEFLAARWVFDAKLHATQLSSLLIGQLPGSHRVLPHLRDSCTWLASLSPEIAREVLRFDAAAALWHANADLAVEVRAEAVAALVNQENANGLRRPKYGFWRSVSRLRHEMSAAQVSTYALDTDLATSARVLALTIAAASRIEGLDSTARLLALAPDTTRAVRIAAARVIEAVGTMDSRRALGPLAIEDDSEKDEQLRGAALSASWVTLTPKELFDTLRPERNSIFYGLYASACHEIVANLPVEYADAALEWLSRAQWPELAGRESRIYDRVLRCVVRAAAVRTDLARPIAKLVLARAVGSRTLWNDHHSTEANDIIGVLRTHDALRLRILEALTQRSLASAEPSLESAASSTSTLSTASLMLRDVWTVTDLRWVSTQIASGQQSGEQRERGVAFLKATIDLHQSDHVSAVWHERHHPAMAEVIPPFVRDALRPELGAEAFAGEQDRLKQEWEAERAAAGRIREERLSQAQHGTRIVEPQLPPTQELGDLFGISVRTRGPNRHASERDRERSTVRGDAKRWPRVVEMHRARQQFRHSEIVLSFRNEYDALPTSLRTLIRSDALAFLRVRKPPRLAGKIDATSATARYAAAAAIILAPEWKVAPGERAMIARKWIPAFLLVWIVDDAANSAFDRAVSSLSSLEPKASLLGLRRALRPLAPPTAERASDGRGKTVRSTVLTLELAAALGAASPPDGRLFAVVVGLGRHSAKLLRGLVEGDFNPTVTDWILEDLVFAGEHEALLKSLPRLLRQHVRGNHPRALALAAQVAATLIRANPSGSSEVVVKMLRGAEDVARGTVVWLTRGTYRLPRLGLADWSPFVLRWLAAWHLESYLPSDDGGGDGDVDDDDDDVPSDANAVRRILLDGFARRPSADAVTSVRELAASRTDLRWLSYDVQRAEDAWDWSRNVQVPPKALWDMKRSRDFRLVRSASELLNVLVEGLDEFAASLRSAHGSPVVLWDQVAPTHSGVARFKPKGESVLSDVLAQHLSGFLRRVSHGITREPVVKTGIVGVTSGERLDLNVFVPIVDRPGEDLHVVVEVKGSWNAAVFGAMKYQLVQRYLRTKRSAAGLYAVGFYSCDAWHKSDARKAKSNSHGDLASMREYLERQAAQLGTQSQPVRAVVVDCRL